MKYFDYKYSDLQYPVMVNNDGSNVLMGKLEIPLSENVEEVEIPIITINTANIEKPEDVEKMVVVERKKVKAYTFFCVAGSEYSRGGDGTEGNPWASINYALHKLKPLVDCVAKYYCCQVYIQLKCSGVCEYYISGNIDKNYEYTGGPFSGKKVFILSDVVLKRKEKKRDLYYGYIDKNGDIGIHDCYIKNMVFNGSDFLCLGYDNIIYDSSFTHKTQKVIKFGDNDYPKDKEFRLKMFLFYGSGTCFISSNFEIEESLDATYIKHNGQCTKKNSSADFDGGMDGWRAGLIYYGCVFSLKCSCTAVSGEYPWGCDYTGVSTRAEGRFAIACPYLVNCKIDVFLRALSLCKSGDASLSSICYFNNLYAKVVIGVDINVTVESESVVESYPPEDGRYVLIENFARSIIYVLKGDVLHNVNAVLSVNLKESAPNVGDSLYCNCGCSFEGSGFDASRYHYNCTCNVSVSSNSDNMYSNFKKYEWEE